MWVAASLAVARPCAIREASLAQLSKHFSSFVSCQQVEEATYDLYKAYLITLLFSFLFIYIYYVQFKNIIKAAA